MSLKQSAASGVKWSSASQFGKHATQILTTIVLAHLLSPTDFGVVGMAMVVAGFLDIIRDLGLGAAVIHRHKVTTTLLSSIFWVNLLFGLFAMGSIMAVSPLAARFYGEPRVALILIGLSIGFPIHGCSLIHQALLEKELEFKPLAKLEIASAIVGSVVGISTALMGAGVWSLVYQPLSMTVVSSGLLWITCKWRPEFVFSWSEMRSVGSYSMNIVGFKSLNYFSRNADYLLIGKFLGAQALGYYSLAYKIMLYPLLSISLVVGRVLFPVLSQMQNDDRKFSDIYLRVTGMIAMLTFPITLGIISISTPFVLGIFGEKWSPMIALIMILSPISLVQSITTIIGNIYPSA